MLIVEVKAIAPQMTHIMEHVHRVCQCVPRWHDGGPEEHCGDGTVVHSWGVSVCWFAQFFDGFAACVRSNIESWNASAIKQVDLDPCIMEDWMTIVCQLEVLMHWFDCRFVQLH